MWKTNKELKEENKALKAHLDDKEEKLQKLHSELFFKTTEATMLKNQFRDIAKNVWIQEDILNEDWKIDYDLLQSIKNRIQQYERGIKELTQKLTEEYCKNKEIKNELNEGRKLKKIIWRLYWKF